MAENFNPAELNRRDTGRLKGYKELLDFYQGIHWEGRERRGDKRLTFNYAKVFIDKVTSYLMSGINFAVDPVEDSDGGRASAEKKRVLGLTLNYSPRRGQYEQRLSLGAV